MRAEVNVQCFGAPRPDATAHVTPEFLEGANFALQTLGVDLEMVKAVEGADIMHSHTWYANFAGHVAGLLGGVPHVITAHSLEPRRPWKAEQLGGGYRLSSWIEASAYAAADAIIAVSSGMRADVLDAYPFVDPAKVHVVYNGIDTEVYKPTKDAAVLAKYGIDAQRPYALFVGRITRQKGIVHLLHAARQFDPEVVLVLCASSPDTPELGAETERLVDVVRAERGEDSVVWLNEPTPRDDLIALFSQALAFACPSIYEPLGIVNLEAMACETAVVASAVGGIPEVVVDGETGILVPYDAQNPTALEEGIAAGINALAADRERAAAMGKAGRQRAVSHFGWPAIADQTMEIYRGLINARAAH